MESWLACPCGVYKQLGHMIRQVLVHRVFLQSEACGRVCQVKQFHGESSHLAGCWLCRICGPRAVGWLILKVSIFWGSEDADRCDFTKAH